MAETRAPADWPRCLTGHGTVCVRRKRARQRGGGVAWNCYRVSILSPIMLRVGRSLVLVLGFLSLQLSLLSGGEKCSVATVFAQSNTGMVGMDMAGMDMAGMGIAGTEIASQHGGSQSDAPSLHDDEQSCEGVVTGTNCDSMTVCVFAAVTAPTSVRNLQRLPSARAPTLAVRTPPTTGDAPELPPPRLQS